MVAKSAKAVACCQVKASDYFFKVEHSKDMEQDVVWLVEKAFYKKYKHLDDQERDVHGLLPKEFLNAMEACWEVPQNMSLDDARSLLISLGFTENNGIT